MSSNPLQSPGNTQARKTTSVHRSEKDGHRITYHRQALAFPDVTILPLELATETYVVKPHPLLLSLYEDSVGHPVQNCRFQPEEPASHLGVLIPRDGGEVTITPLGQEYAYKMDTPYLIRNDAFHLDEYGDPFTRNRLAAVATIPYKVWSGYTFFEDRKLLRQTLPINTEDSPPTE